MINHLATIDALLSKQMMYYRQCEILLYCSEAVGGSSKISTFLITAMAIYIRLVTAEISNLTI